EGYGIAQMHGFKNLMSFHLRTTNIREQIGLIAKNLKDLYSFGIANTLALFRELL
ncbi:hypothetical protein ACJX0J_024548, partial [Zea mays]